MLCFIVGIALCDRCDFCDVSLARSCGRSVYGGGRWLGPSQLIIGVVSREDAVLRMVDDRTVSYIEPIELILREDVTFKDLKVLAKHHNVSIPRHCRIKHAIYVLLNKHECNHTCATVGILTRAPAEILGGSQYQPLTAARMTSFTVVAGELNLKTIYCLCRRYL